MLASTVQFSTYDQTPVTRPHPTRDPHGDNGGMRCRPALTRDTRLPALSGPNSVPTNRTRPRHPVPHATRGDAVLGAAAAAGRTGQRSTLELRLEHPQPLEIEEPSEPEHGSGPPARGWRPVLLRKEVIQPHLPVRLPCYDFVPIADPAFDGSLHKGWATGFGRYRLS